MLSPDERLRLRHPRGCARHNSIISSVAATTNDIHSRPTTRVTSVSAAIPRSAREPAKLAQEPPLLTHDANRCSPSHGEQEGQEAEMTDPTANAQAQQFKNQVSASSQQADA